MLRISQIGTCKMRECEVTFVIREANCQWDGLQLLSEQIPLVQEQNHCCRDKEAGVADFSKETERLLHPVLALVLIEALIVLAHSSDEQNSIDIVETVDPLPALVTLATNIKKSIMERHKNIINMKVSDDSRVKYIYIYIYIYIT